MNFYAYAANSPMNFTDPMGTSATTFLKGLRDGALSWTVVGGILVGIGLQALLGCVTGGAATALQIAITAMVAAAYASLVAEVVMLIKAILNSEDCPDNIHYRIGKLIGEFVAAAVGGQLAKGFKFCFVAGTLVHTKEGLKKIEDVKEGDEVLSYNEQTGQTEYQPVVNTFVNQVEESLQIKVKGEKDEIGVSYGHPFFVKIRNQNKSNFEGTWLKELG